MTRDLLNNEIENDDNITWCQHVSDFNPVGAYATYVPATYDNATHWYCNEAHNDPYCEIKK